MPLGLAAVVLGVLSMQRVKKEPGRYGGKGIAMAGIGVGALAALGYIGQLVFWIVLRWVL